MQDDLQCGRIVLPVGQHVEHDDDQRPAAEQKRHAAFTKQQKAGVHDVEPQFEQQRPGHHHQQHFIVGQQQERHNQVGSPMPAVDHARLHQVHRQRNEKVQPVRGVDPRHPVEQKAPGLDPALETATTDDHHHETADDKEQIDTQLKKIEHWRQKDIATGKLALYRHHVKQHHTQDSYAPEPLQGIQPLHASLHSALISRAMYVITRVEHSQWPEIRNPNLQHVAVFPDRYFWSKVQRQHAA